MGGPPIRYSVENSAKAYITDVPKKLWSLTPPSLACMGHISRPAQLWGAEHGEKWEIDEIAIFHFFDKWTNFIFSVRGGR